MLFPAYRFATFDRRAPGLWKLPRYRNRGKPNCGFPPFPQRLENSPKNGEFPTVPTAPTARYIDENKIQKNKKNHLQVHVTCVD